MLCNSDTFWLGASAFHIFIPITIDFHFIISGGEVNFHVIYCTIFQAKYVSLHNTWSISFFSRSTT